MKVILFGATGMIGQGVLRECLLAEDVTEVLSVGRSVTGQAHPKLREIKHPSLTDYSAIKEQLRGYDACFFCLGVSSAGMNEAAYRAVTYDIPVAAAEALAPLNPSMTFGLITGAHTDAQSKTMWARVKGESEVKVRALPFKRVVCLRPGFIEPLHGITSRTAVYRIIYVLMRPFIPLMKKTMPGLVTSTESIGRAMLNVARRGSDKDVLESPDIIVAAA